MQITTRNQFAVKRAPSQQGGKKVLEQLANTEKIAIIKLLDDIIEHAYSLRASDVHFDPGEKQMMVRFRIDGVLHDMYQCPASIQTALISRIKILSGLPTDEHQAGLDGRFTASITKASVDVRVSIAPTYYGENAVLRLLSKTGEEFTLGSLGFSRENIQKIMWAIRRPFGMVLATGPTGSGKTTTLYTLVKILNTRETSIITVEDPIEYAISGINQIQVNDKSSLGFANGLRSVLRQDPNIIMVGEIRDSETASIAVNTALTGHLLLSTLHTNDAATTLPRLLDLKIEAYLIASTVTIAIAQRLVRKICPQCKQGKHSTPTEIKSLSEIIPETILNKQKEFFYGKGCEACNFTGYGGRIGVQEVLVPDNAIREAILRKAPAAEIKKLAIDQGMTTMVKDAFEKAKIGITTLDEILRMLHE